MIEPRSRSLRLLPALALALLALLPVEAQAAGHPELHVYFQTSLQDAAVQRQIFAALTQAFHTPGRKQLPAPGKKTVVQGVLSQEGKLVSAQVTLESGSKAWDDAALAAFQKAQGLPRLPPGLATVDVHFHVTWVAKDR